LKHFERQYEGALKHIWPRIKTIVWTSARVFSRDKI